MNKIVDKDKNVVIETQRQIPISQKTQIIVAGGGVAGLSAAITAGRLGTNTLLIEQNGFLGGVATAGLCGNLMGVDFSIIGGILREVVEEMRKRKSACIGIHTQFDPEAFKYLVLEILREAKVSLLLHSWIAASIVEDNQIKGVIVENKSGRQAILAEIVIDATGDADVADRAGVPYNKGERCGEIVQPVTLLFRMGNVDSHELMTYFQENPDQLYQWPFLCFQDFKSSPPRFQFDGFFKLIELAKMKGKLNLDHNSMAIISTPREGEVLINATSVIDVDGTNVQDLTRAEIESRRQMWSTVEFLREFVPGFKNSHLIDSGSSIGVRETRQVIGRYILTQRDILHKRKFSDAIARNFFPMDIHGPRDNRKGHSWIAIEAGEFYEIPYRCLVPKTVECLLVAGRCISASHEAQGSIRSMPCCMATGQAAGTAAALCVKNQVSPHRLDVSALRDALKRQGVVV